MPSVVYSKLIFLDGRDGIQNSRQLNPQFHVPTNAFSCDKDQSMRLVLKSFTMPKDAMYDVNQTNNTFFYRDTSTSTDNEINLDFGDYTASGLATHVQAKVVARMGAGFTCTYNATTKKLEMSIPSSYPDGFFVAYRDKSIAHYLGAGDNQKHYSDANELLGGSVSTDLTQPKNMFNGGDHTNGSATAVTTKYPIRLSTLDNILLRCGLQGDAYCSTTHEPFRTGNKLHSTDIWASIPNVANDHNLIVFDDNSEDFQINLKQSQISTLKLALSDGKGRELPLIDTEQGVDGNMSFQVVAKLEVLSDPHEPAMTLEGVKRYTHPPQLTA